MTKMLKRVLQDVLSKEENEQLISAFDQIGDIIIVRIPDSLVSKKQIIGKTLLEQVSTANSIFYQFPFLHYPFKFLIILYKSLSNRFGSWVYRLGARRNGRISLLGWKFRFS